MQIPTDIDVLKMKMYVTKEFGRNWPLQKRFNFSKN